METKNLNNIITITWIMVFCVNLTICLWASDPHPLCWVMVGFPIGMLVMNLINGSVLNIQDKLIRLLEHIIERQKKLIGEKKK